ncbi:MAG: zinc ribbon domain-containing protein [Candidatus Dormibacteria bacterium]
MAEALAEVEGLDRRRAELEEEQQASRRRARGDAELTGLGRRREGLEDQARQLSSQLKQLELEVGELAERRRSHERAIYDGSVRHPADLQRRQHELQTLKERISQMEDRELAEMESQERLQADLRQVDGQLEERRALVEAQRERDQARGEGLSAELETVVARREDIAGSIPASALRLYERTAARRQPAVARVVASKCTGCRLPLPHRTLEELRRDQLVSCENCERILLL